MSGPVVFIPPFRQLVDGVSRYLAENNVSAIVERGLGRSHVKPVPGRGNRVIFYGSKPDGSAGAIVNPRQVGIRNIGGTADAPEFTVRPLSDWARTVYVSIWAQDLDRPNDEGAQDDAVYQLFAWVQRAVQSVAYGNAVWGSTKFTVPVDRAFGLELLADLTFQHMMPDLPVELVRPDPFVTKGLP